MMSPLAFVALLQLLSLPPLAYCNWLIPSVLQNNSPHCFDIPVPFPFGINGIGTFRPGFAITCNNTQGDPPMLSLGTNLQFQLLNISLEGYVRIVGRAITWFCYNTTTGEDVRFRLAIDLKGTPFTFSDTMNKFTATGCDAMAMIQGSGPHNYTGGCVSFCATRHSVIDGSCSGVGCCQASVPRGLQSLKLNFSSIRAMTGSKNDTSGTCSKAFIVDKDWFKFSAEDLVGNANDEYRPVVLEWSIGNQTCEEVQRRKPPDYACVDGHSRCYNSGNGIGYRCNCSEGYAGNPYVPGGCQDIDECKDPRMNNCVWRCINKGGGFDCICPSGSSGDGRTPGSGCRKVAALEIGLGLGLALLVMLLLVGGGAYWGVKRRKTRKLKQKLIPYDQTHMTTLVQGTLGYLDPEYFQTSILTEKSDVYSFGVVLMELLMREKPISPGRPEEERNLAFHFIMLLEENRLLSVVDRPTVEEAGERQLYAVAQLARRCLNLRGEDRPTMKEVAVELDALGRLLMQHSAREESRKPGRWSLSVPREFRGGGTGVEVGSSAVFSESSFTGR
ncbi:hypothetical protein OPV22_000245 [Ensete ventricosum]|uniref:EGF-like domain-containing protein n=1 Tax=Ensete ventricosum TaxID=4639 RepID=A0AAV8Q8Q8_ENSVE|nr:hypothetical protein OPV22_000245 [Ensete ventricosum]